MSYRYNGNNVCSCVAKDEHREQNCACSCHYRIRSEAAKARAAARSAVQRVRTAK